MEIQWYWIEQDGKHYPAFFDGKEWIGKKHNGEHKVKSPIPFGCPLGCRCFTNPDGSVTVDCTPQ